MLQAVHDMGARCAVCWRCGTNRPSASGWRRSARSSTSARSCTRSSSQATTRRSLPALASCPLFESFACDAVSVDRVRCKELTRAVVGKGGAQAHHDAAPDGVHGRDPVQQGPATQPARSRAVQTSGADAADRRGVAGRRASRAPGRGALQPHGHPEACSNPPGDGVKVRCAGLTRREAQVKFRDLCTEHEAKVLCGRERCCPARLRLRCATRGADMRCAATQTLWLQAATHHGSPGPSARSLRALPTRALRHVRY
eukprot:2552675-Rhodomonas_salina.2